MNRKTLLTLGVFAALVVIAVVVQRQPEKGERTGAGQRPIAEIKAGDVDTLDITNAGKTSTLKSENGKYLVTAPVAYPAEESAAKDAFEALTKLSFNSIITDQPGKQAEFEVDDAKAIHVVAKKGTAVVADFLVGKQVSGNVALRLPGKNEIWQASGLTHWSVARDAAGWRDKSITTFSAGDVETLDIKTKSQGAISLKREGEGKWTVTSTSTPIDKLDVTVADGVVSSLSSWKTSDFADGAKLGEIGLEPPRSTVTVGLKGGKKVTVLLGNKKGEDEFYVKSAENPQVFVVKKWGMDRLDKRPVDFKDKTVCNLAEADIGEISVVNGKDSVTLVHDKDWKVTKPSGFALDTSKVSNIASAFKDWKATGFAEDTSLPANGLDKPRAQITAKSKDKKTTCSLKVGNENKDKTGYSALVAGKPDVFVVAKWTADRVMPKLDELKKK